MFMYMYIYIHMTYFIGIMMEATEIDRDNLLFT